MSNQMMVTIAASRGRYTTRTTGQAHLYRVIQYYDSWPFEPDSRVPARSASRKRTETFRTLEPVRQRLARANLYAQPAPQWRGLGCVRDCGRAADRPRLAAARPRCPAAAPGRWPIHADPAFAAWRGPCPVAAPGRPERGDAPVTGNLRQAVHDQMAQLATRHAASKYPGVLDGDTAAQLFALLADTALAYQMQVEAELADPGPGQSLAAASGLTARQALFTGLAENLDLKEDNPAMAPVNGWLAWRTADGETTRDRDQPRARAGEVDLRRGAGAGRQAPARLAGPYG
jgi:hypothetical protein